MERVDRMMNVVHEMIRTLSWSRLNAYLQCPRKFFYNYVEQRSHERTSAALVFGSGLHRAFEAMNEYRLISDHPLPFDEVLGAYAAGWRIESDGKNIEFGKNESNASLNDLAERMLKAFVTHQTTLDSKNKVVAVEHEASFALIPDAPPFVARLDLVELSSDGDLVITDYKTSRSLYNEQKIRDAWPQVIAYSAAAMPLLRELGAKRVVPQLIVVTKAKAPKVQIIRPQATQDDVERLKKLAQEVWKAIQDENFMPREGWQCNSCPFRDACRGGGSCEAV
jgi:CRISPR/Cas system-associated exonuclease Cas4 (RecB family)